MNIDLSAPIKQIQSMLNEGLGRLPMILIAIAVFMLMYYASRWLRTFVERTVVRGGRRQNISLLLGRLTQGLLVFAGLLMGFLIVFPSVDAQNIVQLFGIGSVAIGFAFRDILQNFLAGLLILVNEPFTIDDRIRVRDFEGVVKDIQARATILETTDRRKVVMPNSILFTEAVVVLTNSIPAPTPEHSPGATPAKA